VRLLDAREACGNPPQEADCRVIGSVVDTVSIGPTEPVLLRYVVFNRGDASLTQIEVTDGVYGAIGTSTEPLAPDDSLVINRIVDAPTIPGVTFSSGSATATDAGGNTATGAQAYGINVLGPRVSIDTFVGRADVFCTDISDASTCSEFETTADTLFALSPREAFVVRYVAVNSGSTPLARVEITDAALGPVGTSTDLLTPGDSLIFTRIYNASNTPGIQASSGTVTAEDRGGNTSTTSDRYAVQTQGLAFRIITFTGPVSLLCSDRLDPSTCSPSLLRTYRSDPEAYRKALRAAAKERSEREVAFYGVVNTGTDALARHTIEDGIVGVVAQDTLITVDASTSAASRDSVGFFRIYDAVTQLGQARTVTWSAETEDGQRLAVTSEDPPPPVELSGFGADVQERNVMLDWTTATEQNNAGFEVQRFDAAEDAWQVIEFVPGAGASTEPTAYQYDVGPLDPDVYRFRLRQISDNGQFAVSSEIEAVVMIDGPYRLTDIAPHPVQSTGDLSLTVREEQSVRVDLYDLLGRRVGTVMNDDLTAGKQHPITLDAGRLSSGVYFLRVTGETFATTQRVTVVR
jgi:hypothetical protein